MSNVISKLMPYAMGAALAVISAFGGSSLTDSFAIITSEDAATHFCAVQASKK